TLSTFKMRSPEPSSTWVNRFQPSSPRGCFTCQYIVTLSFEPGAATPFGSTLAPSSVILPSKSALSFVPTSPGALVSTYFARAVLSTSFPAESSAQAIEAPESATRSSQCAPPRAYFNQLDPCITPRRVL